MADRFVIEVYNLNPRVFMWRFISSILPNVGDYIKKIVYENESRDFPTYYKVKYRSIAPHTDFVDCSILLVYVEETTEIPKE